jgi:hypothetical protein
MRILLFTGQVRSERELLTQVDLLQNQFDRALVSTWTTQPNLDGLRTELDRRGCELVLSEMPVNVPKLSGTRFFQIRSLESALAETDPGDVVFKTRHEVTLTPELVRDALAAQDNAATLDGWPFSKPLWVGDYRPHACFFVDDRCILGLASDLKHLCDYRDSFDVPMSPFLQVEHVPRWGLPLVDSCPIFADFLQYLYAPFRPRLSAWLGYPRSRRGYNGALHRAVMPAYEKSPDYANVMRAYRAFVRECLLFSPFEQLQALTFRGNPLTERSYCEPPAESETVAARHQLLETRIDPRRAAAVCAEASNLALRWFVSRGWRYAASECVARAKSAVRRCSPKRSKLANTR